MTPSPQNKGPVLDARLAAAAGYVRRGGVAADVGADHGKLAAALLCGGVCERVIATDARPAPLARARALCAQWGCAGRVDFRLGDGLSVLRPGEADDVVIAGLSGVTIAGILAAAPAGLFSANAAPRLILIPASKDARLRRFLLENGFSLLDETPVRAAGRCYAVLCAAYTGERRAPTALECAVGRAAKGADGAAYLEGAAGRVEQEALGARGAARAALLALAAEIRERARSALSQ